MKRILLLILILIVFLAGCREKGGQIGPDAPPDAVPEIAGKYVVNGIDPLGMEYSGHLTIFAGDEPGAYTLQWIVIGNVQEGTGLLKGNQLQVAWRTVEHAGEFSQGTATFTVTVNRELYGTRTAEGMSGEGTETAYPED